MEDASNMVLGLVPSRGYTIPPTWVITPTRHISNPTGKLQGHVIEEQEVPQWAKASESPHNEVHIQRAAWLLAGGNGNA